MYNLSGALLRDRQTIHCARYAAMRTGLKVLTGWSKRLGRGLAYQELRRINNNDIRPMRDVYGYR
jgi:hypothetical protein